MPKRKSAKDVLKLILEEDNIIKLLNSDNCSPSSKPDYGEFILNIYSDLTL